MATTIDRASRIHQLQAEFRRLKTEQERLNRRMEDIGRALNQLVTSDASARNRPEPLEFYARVRVEGAAGASGKLNGSFGVVLGRSQDARGRWGYAVRMESDQNCWDLQGDVLIPTGETLSREAFYDGSTVRVSVDAEGKGTAKKPPRSR
jgi:hypothetical protein